MHQLQLCIKQKEITIPHYIGDNLWGILLKFINESFPESALFIITDANVFSLYREELLKHFSTLLNFQDILVIPAGEKSKSRTQKTRLEDELLRAHAGRDTLLIACGGGVVGDLAGFVAATLHRGVAFIQMPTSLLAQVDSSIGGKVGINHPTGKNLLGAFYQPRAVFSDITFLKTLPEEEFLNGLAEVIKYAIILDEELLQWLENDHTKILQRDEPTLTRIITRCQELKIKVVEQDEKEHRYRSILNFGHTVGHALEQLSGYHIKHGFAIATGMLVELQLSHQLLNFPLDMVYRLENLLDRYHLNRISFQQFPINQIWETLLYDKKARQYQPHCTLMEAPYQPRLFYPLKKGELEYVWNRA